jgi:hypothetical protein
MAHQRQVIREAVVAQLKGRTSAEDRVFKSREIPLKRCELPAICVYTLEETVDQDSRQSSPRRLSRPLQVAVELVVENSEDVDDVIDALALEVEDALEADPFFGSSCVDSMLASTQIGIDVTGAKPVGRALMAYAVLYETTATAATLDDLTKVHTETSLGGQQAPGDRAVDEIPIPTT